MGDRDPARHHPHPGGSAAARSRPPLRRWDLELARAPCRRHRRVDGVRPARRLGAGPLVQADVYDATIVQRHPAGSVRVVGSFGVLRWQGFTWHHEPPVGSWIDVVTACPANGDPEILEAMLEFAVHDLGSMGIGSLLLYRPDPTPGPAVEERLPTPPPLIIRRPAHLAPLRHALAQVDGAAVFDAEGVLRSLGVRLVPSPAAEQTVDAFRGTRHTSGRRYSRDDPRATVIAVSEDGPVSVMHDGAILGRSDKHE
jgi:DisA bacterial checkpoint controller nucleotide-binding